MYYQLCKVYRDKGYSNPGGENLLQLDIPTVEQKLHVCNFLISVPLAGELAIASMTAQGLPG